LPTQPSYRPADSGKVELPPEIYVLLWQKSEANRFIV
jgi:hypothetical protein